MAKKQKKKVGRKLVDIETYFTKIEPYLSIGFSLHKSCELANIPYQTMLDRVHKDDNLRARVEILKNDTNLHARSKLIKRIKGKKYDHKAIMDWLNNMDEDFKVTKEGGNLNVQINNVIEKQREKYKFDDN